MSALNMDELDFKIGIKPHFDRPRMLSLVDLVVTDLQRTKIASGSGMIINRFRMGDAFHMIMDEDDAETASFSMAIFDKFGRIHSRLVDEEFHKGSGVWGRELNEGMIIFLFEMSVEPLYERKGIGSQLLRRFVQSEHVKERDIIYCWPSPTRSEARQGTREVFNRHTESIISFFRKNGFRRVGRTKFFAYSLDPNHPSRQLPSSSDVDGYMDPDDLPTDRMTMEERFMRYPVHVLVVNDKSEKIDQSLRALFALDPAYIHALDDQYITPISLAVTANNENAIKTLLALGVSDDLMLRNPTTGNRPLDSYREYMNQSKQMIDMFGAWKGYDEANLKVEAMLKRAMGILTDTSDDEYVKKMKYGCTCGTCGGGWLSPRMRFRLQSQAYLSNSNMDVLMPDFQRGKALIPSLFCSEVEYLPLHLQKAVFKTFYLGYRSLFYVVGEILEAELPTVEKIHEYLRSIPESHSDRSINFYTKKGGRVEYVLDSVTALAKEQSADCGDGAFDEMMTDELREPDEGDKQWRDLPYCANDGEYGLVRAMMGLDPEETHGPYYSPAYLRACYADTNEPGESMQGADDGS